MRYTEHRDWFDEHADHGGIGGLDFVTAEGWEARQFSCACGDTHVQVSAMPASPIDPDPHLGGKR